MIIELKDPARYLYHYTKASIASEKILPKCSLMINSFGSTNDPKEAKQWEFDLGTNENRDFAKYDQMQISRKLSKELKERTKVICFSKDRSPLTGNHIEDICNRGFCKPRMWAQYADRHSGVCLVFDKGRLERAISKTFSRYKILQGDVKYIDRSVIPNLDEEGDYTINVDLLERYGLKAYANVHLKTYYKRLFFEKMTDWSHEDESRWVLFIDTSDALYFDYEDALKGIVFGENTDVAVIDKIINLTDYKVEYIGLKWKNCSPWYDLGNLKYDKALRNSPWFRNNKS